MPNLQTVLDQETLRFGDFHLQEPAGEAIAPRLARPP
jgi:hypothetical protein